MTKTAIKFGEEAGRIFAEEALWEALQEELATGSHRALLPLDERGWAERLLQGVSPPTAVKILGLTRRQFDAQGRAFYAACVAYDRAAHEAALKVLRAAKKAVR